MNAHKHFLVAVGYVPEETHAQIHEQLITTTAWWRYFPNLWIICTPHDAQYWQNRLSELLKPHPTATLMIIALSGHSEKNGLLPQEAWDWLAGHHL